MRLHFTGEAEVLDKPPLKVGDTITLDVRVAVYRVEGDVIDVTPLDKRLQTVMIGEQAAYAVALAAQEVTP